MCLPINEKKSASMNLFKFSILSLPFLTASLIGRAQRTILSVGGASSLTIKSGTVFSADSLVLTPGVDFTLASNSIGVTPTAIPFNPTPGISRVYNLNSPVNFTGILKLYYQPSELNGNVEGGLLFSDSSVSSPWVAELTSTVNAVSHFVQLTAAGHSFNAATASGVIVPLPITLISFTGVWQNNGVALEWLVAQSDELVNFGVEASPDGTNWKEIGEVPGLKANGLYTYNFLDNNPAPHTMYYQIRIILPSGQSRYSYIVVLHQGDNNNDVRLFAGNNGVSVHFMGTQPDGIRIINAVGQILRVDQSRRSEYDINGLSAGVYFLQYEMNGRWRVRQFLIK
jgi:hypothetical protein